MRVLYVAGTDLPDTGTVMQELVWLEPTLQVDTVEGAAAALVNVRGEAAYRAVFLGPSLPPNEALALIATLRRDRIPVAILAILAETNSAFLAQALAAGADDVLVLRPDGVTAAEETLHRIRHNRHAEPVEDQARLMLLYVGEDDHAWSLLQELPFSDAERATCDADGSCPRALPDPDSGNLAIDVLVVDDNPGAAHALQVVKWAKARVPDLPVVVLTSATAGDLAGAALDLGADDVISKVGTYRRRLVAALYRLYLRRMLGRTSLDTSDPRVPHADPQIESLRLAEARITQLSEELASTQETLAALKYQHRRAEDALQSERAARERAEADLARPRTDPGEVASLQSRIERLESEARAASEEAASLRALNSQLTEAEGFERALRDRDRSDLSAVRQSLAEERDRRIVLEGTLRHTEDALEQARRERESEPERGQLHEHPLVGYAVLGLDGGLLQCSRSFAAMFGYSGPEEAGEATPGTPFAGLPDHARVRETLESGQDLARVESTARRSDGRPFRVLTSARLLGPTRESPARIERWCVDVSDRKNLEDQLRLARRLEAAGRLAAEMSPEIEAGLSSLAPAPPPTDESQDARRVVTLVRQLLSFSRRQARPAGFISLNDALSRSAGLLRQIAGDAIEVVIAPGDVDPVAAGEDDIEQLLAEAVFAMAGCLPFGGSLTFETASVTSDLLIRTQLTATAAGYGVHALSVSSSLTRTITRCGGSVHTGGDAGRTSTLHVIFPS